MQNYWWLSAKTYVRDRCSARWVNQEACVPTPAAARFGERYAAADRNLSLLARPHFDLEERTRRPLDLRSLGGTFPGDLDPYFLISTDFLDVILAIDPDCLTFAECDLSAHGRAPHAICYLADATLAVDAWTAVDRAQSDVALVPGYDEAGARAPFLEFMGRVQFRSDVVGARAMFRVLRASGGKKIAVSNALAEAIFARELMGLELEDPSGARKAPKRYRQYATDCWEEIYPA
jgi:hypothetical protein